MNLFLSKHIDLSDKETVVMAILNGLYSNKNENLYVSINLLGHAITGRFLNVKNQKDRTIITGIKEGLNSLIDREIIEVIDCNNNDYILSSKGLTVNTEKEKFVVVEQWEMHRIFEMGNKPFGIFDFFATIVGTINNTTKEWHMSQDTMVEVFGSSKRTINDYLQQLEEMQLLYVFRPKKRRTDGTFQNVNNSYGRYADKEKVMISAMAYVETIECEDTYSKIDRRAIKLRYNAYCNGAKKYKNNPKLVESLMQECIEYNKSLEFKPVEGGYDGEFKQGTPLDMSVFPNVFEKEKDEDIWGEDIDDDEWDLY